jgi:hypothetical protein
MNTASAWGISKEEGQRLIELVLRQSGELNSYLADVCEAHSGHDMRPLKRAIGAVMGEALTQLLNPVFLEWPDLAPPELRESNLKPDSKP